MHAYACGRCRCLLPHEMATSHRTLRNPRRQRREANDHGRAERLQVVAPAPDTDDLELDAHASGRRRPPAPPRGLAVAPVWSAPRRALTAPRCLCPAVSRLVAVWLPEHQSSITSAATNSSASCVKEPSMPKDRANREAGAGEDRSARCIRRVTLRCLLEFSQVLKD